MNIEEILNKSRLEDIEKRINECNSYYHDLEAKEWLVHAISKDDVLFLLSLAKRITHN